jgi:hypothetical protein
MSYCAVAPPSQGRRCAGGCDKRLENGKGKEGNFELGILNVEFRLALRGFETRGGNVCVIRRTEGFRDRGWRISGGGLVGQSRLIKVDQSKSNRKRGRGGTKLENGTAGWGMPNEGRVDMSGDRFRDKGWGICGERRMGGSRLVKVGQGRFGRKWGREGRDIENGTASRRTRNFGGSCGMRNRGGADLASRSCDKGWKTWAGGLVSRSRLIKVDQSESDRKRGSHRRRMGQSGRSYVEITPSLLKNARLRGTNGVTASGQP